MDAGAETVRACCWSSCRRPPSFGERPRWTITRRLYCCILASDGRFIDC